MTSCRGFLLTKKGDRGAGDLQGIASRSRFRTTQLGRGTASALNRIEPSRGALSGPSGRVPTEQRRWCFVSASKRKGARDSRELRKGWGTGRGRGAGFTLDVAGRAGDGVLGVQRSRCEGGKAYYSQEIRRDGQIDCARLDPSEGAPVDKAELFWWEKISLGGLGSGGGRAVVRAAHHNSFRNGGADRGCRQEAGGPAQFGKDPRTGAHQPH